MVQGAVGGFLITMVGASGGGTGPNFCTGASERMLAGHRDRIDRRSGARLYRRQRQDVHRRRCRLPRTVVPRRCGDSWISWSTMRPSARSSTAPPDAMPELQTVPDLLGKAESAAAAGDLASADELLRAIARIQEDELGPLHPDLANTLNNLAIVAEKQDELATPKRSIAAPWRLPQHRSRRTIRCWQPAGRTSRISAARRACRSTDRPSSNRRLATAEPEPQAIASESAGADVKASAGPEGCR